MRRKKSLEILFIIVCISVPLFFIGIAETVSTTKSFSGVLVHRFSLARVNGVQVNFYYEKCSYPFEQTDPVTVYTGYDSYYGDGYWEVSEEPPSDWGIWSAWIEILKNGYIEETIELCNSQNTQRHFVNCITPIYECTIFGYVMSLFLQGISVELWCIDVHDCHFFCAFTTTNFIGYYGFNNLEFDFAFPEVPAYYYIKVPYFSKTEDVDPYPYPDGVIRVPNIDPW